MRRVNFGHSSYPLRSYLVRFDVLFSGLNLPILRKTKTGSTAIPHCFLIHKHAVSLSFSGDQLLSGIIIVALPFYIQSVE